jgi:hypothetical protein
MIEALIYWSLMLFRMLGPLAATLSVLGIVGGERVLFEPPARQVEASQARVRAAADAMPNWIGPWLGKSIAQPAAALRILHPNVMLSRRFTNSDTGEQFSLLFVQVGDSRDILGHYPPVCYPSLGWTMQSATSQDWQNGQLNVHGMEYAFSRNHLEGQTRIIVDNFLFLADDATYRNMQEMQSAARNRRRWGLGAGQAQFIFDPVTPSQRRSEIVQTFLKSLAPILDAMSSGDGV